MRPEFPIRTSDQLTGVLQAFRKESGMSQTDVAERMGLTQQKLSHLELNAQKASADRILRLLSVLGVELVLRRTDAPSQTTPSSITYPW
ncbi:MULTISPECIES: helix-turn-helix domain-containing protein [unclassified Delftia]|uniref:helix-turn-helix domain-containing protein n=1 Tax=unclassified Delftia TaxID=2613839 RepID=UPI001901C929|nr:MULTISPECIES: helix-turn-helix transcriptional regulator [unclassified Delftia]MBK0114086.1 helix-turn-helix transcriptional regulator [Delftia sp. S65]MBK0117894.1 helix-turn-helix transcriptional regulator [Delftia sp. S67]MBK0129107.1 helix-turn-helix transcriptional regulator [Delftia sp. S66]